MDFKTSVVFTIIAIGLYGCDWPWGQSVSKASCLFAYGAFEESYRKAVEANGSEKYFYISTAEMNLQILLSRGCCRFEEACPASVNP